MKHWRLRTELIPALISPEPNTGCWLWLGKTDRDGYGVFGRKNARVHRVLWAEANGPIPDGLFACHRCDNPLCVNPGHIFLGTAKDNVDDMAAKGRRRCVFVSLVGSRHPRARIDEAAAIEVVSAVRGGESPSRVAARIGVSVSCVSSVMRGRTWSHVTGINKRRDGRATKAA